MERMGKPVPVLQDEPELYPYMKIYFRAFRRLRYSRNTGGLSGMGYIPYSEIICYLNEEKIMHPEERDEYIEMIQLIDSIEMDIQGKNAKKKQKKTAKKQVR